MNTIDNYIYLNERVYGPVERERPSSIEKYNNWKKWEPLNSEFWKYVRSLPSYPAPDLKCKQGQVVEDGKDFEFDEHPLTSDPDCGVIKIAIPLPATETGSEGKPCDCSLNDRCKITGEMKRTPCYTEININQKTITMQSLLTKSDSDILLQEAKESLRLKDSFEIVNSTGAKLGIDGDQYFYGFGELPEQTGVHGFGKTPRSALSNFVDNYYSQTVNSQK